MGLPPVPKDDIQTMTLNQRAERAIRLATNHAKLIVHADGHWAGPLLCDTTFTTQYIFTLVSLNQPITEADRASYTEYFLSAQEQDGSWALAPSYPYGGNLSVTVETYLALKMLGFSPSDPVMERAKSWILAHGGIAKVRNTTRVFLAMFGILSWSSIPQLPPEIMFLPSWFPLSIYRTGIWARTVVVPLLVLRAHEPVYPLLLPGKTNTASSSHAASYLDELWCSSPATVDGSEPKPRYLPYTKPPIALLLSNLVAFIFQLLDLLMLYVLTPLLVRLPTRRIAIEACMRYMIRRQDPEGPYGGFTISLCLYLQCLSLGGHDPASSRELRAGLEALRGDVWTWPDDDAYTGEAAKKGRRGKYLQGSNSPIWDTLLMIRGLLDCRDFLLRYDMTPDQKRRQSQSIKNREVVAGEEDSAGTRSKSGLEDKKEEIDALIKKGLEFIKSKEIRDEKAGDWQVYRPNVQPGSYSFQYVNRWFPDVDDTAVAVLTFLEARDVCAQETPLRDLVKEGTHEENTEGEEEEEKEWSRILRAAKWCLAMQNSDGGWAAFDSSDGAKWLWNSIPFSDMDCMCDSSCPDITGRCLEMLGLLGQKVTTRVRERDSVTTGRGLGDKTRREWSDDERSRKTRSRLQDETSLMEKIDIASQRGINYLRREQADFGAWWARWGINYLYGTSNALCGLFYFRHLPRVKEMIDRAVAWLESVQNEGGGWGEQDDSFVDPSRAGKGRSTPSQTAWALMALLTCESPESVAVVRGVRFLVEGQIVSKKRPNFGRSGLSGWEMQEEEQKKQVGEAVVVAKENGTWEQETYTGVGHPNQVCFGYDLYRHYFPMIALGRYLKALDADGQAV